MNWKSSLSLDNHSTNWTDKAELPLLIVDVGFQTNTESYIKRDDRFSGEMAINEIGYTLINDDIQASDDVWDDITILDFTDSENVDLYTELFDVVVSASSSIISHNLETDLSVLINNDIISESTLAKRNLFCTAALGLPYSKLHIYRNGKKIKRTPTLVDLYNNLTGGSTGKGDIAADVYMTAVCFIEMLNKENDNLH